MRKPKPTERAGREAGLCDSEAGELLCFVVETEEKRRIDDKMKLQVTLKRYTSNTHFNSLKSNVRRCHMVMSPELPPGHSNGQFSALSSTFFGKAWAVTGRY